MLEIINNLKPFFEDCYRRVNVREYARIMDISAPTASKLLESFGKKGLLLMEKDRNYIFYYANKESKDFIDLSRIYWRLVLKDFIITVSDKMLDANIVLFGSLSKSEVRKESDIDICIFGEKKHLEIKNIEHKLKREFQLFFFESLDHIKNKELANNIANGYILYGKMVL